jgi:iron complex outermembrane recepter protein
MKNPNAPRRPLTETIRMLSAFSLLICPSLFAQETADDEQVLELSPFEVSADSEIGYLATETLSGTRLRSNLGDIGASVDVLTKEFLSDIAAVDMYDALDFVGNVDTYAVAGGFGENENEVWFSQPYIARGFRTSSVSSDFFSMGRIPLDFYNKSNFTVARGPNAVLYGIGSPGGIVNATRNRPVFGRNFGEVQVRVDDNGSFRSSLDFGYEVAEDKLSIRGALLYDDRKEFLDPAGFIKTGAYGAITYRPFKSTTITATFEQGNEDRTFRYTNMVYDAITPWLNAGSPTFAAPGTPIDGSLGSGLDVERRMTLLINDQPEIPIQSWWRMARTERFEIANHPDQGRIRATGFTEDTAIWDFDETQLVGESRNRESEWEDFSIFLTQEIFVPELQLELAYNRIYSEYLLANTFGQFYLQMDANEQMPNGEPNPNFGSPYLEADRHDVIGEENTTDSFRATLSYQLDLNDRKIFGDIGLGRYTIMGLWEEVETDTLFAGFRRVFTEIPGLNNNNLLSGLLRVRNRTYLDTTLTPAGANVEPYFKPDYTLIDRDGATSGWVRMTSPRDILDTRSSQVAALQAFLWQTEQDYDRIILTAGFRNDKQTSQRKNYTERVQRAFAGDNWRGDPFALDAAGKEAFWDGTLNYGTLGDRSITEEPTKTYSAVAKLTKDLSVFYNFSDVLISSSSLFTDIYDNFVDGTIGETNDFGVRLNLWDNKLVTAVTFFETTALNQQESSPRTQITPELEDIWEVVDPNRPDFNERYVTLRDDSSEGMEFSLTANLLPGWSTRVAVSQIETIVNDRLPVVRQYFAEFSPIWEANRNLPLSADAVQDPDYLTVGDALDRVNRDLGDLLLQIGTVPRSQREWKVVFNTNYRIRDGALKGLALGGGFRWLEADIIGYGYNENQILDPTKPFFGDDIFTVSTNISYSTKLFDRDVRFQLNVNNLLNNDGTFARSATDDLTGNPYFGRQQVQAPRSFIFSATFDL